MDFIIIIVNVDMPTNPWIAHLKKFRASGAGKGLSLKASMQKAKKTYTKVGKRKRGKKKSSK